MQCSRHGSDSYMFTRYAPAITNVSETSSFTDQTVLTQNRPVGASPVVAGRRQSAFASLPL
jgi:hypothetical protein